MNRPALGVLRNRRAFVHRLADDVEDPAQCRLADGDGNGLPGIDHVHAAHDAVGRAHGDGPDLVAADVLLDFRDQLSGIDLHGDRVIELGQLLGLELDVEDGSDDLHHFTDVVFHNL